MADAVKHVRVLDDVDAYKYCHDGKWVDRMYNLAEMAPKLSSPIDSVLVAFKGVANVVVWPHLSVQMLHEFSKVVANEPAPRVRRVIEAISEKLSERLSPQFSDEQIEVIERQVQDIVKRVPPGSGKFGRILSMDELWKDFFTLDEFQLSTWYTQRVGYCDLYFAYEDFLVQCYKVKVSDPGFRLPNYDNFKPLFRAAFGDSLCDECLAHVKVNAARLVRNCLAHNGGRADKKLQKQHHRPHIEEGEVQLLASDVRALYDDLKVRAEKLAKAAARMAEFK